MIKGTLQKKGRIYHAKYWYQGKRRSKTTGQTNRREAEKKLVQMLAPLNASNTSRAHLKAAAEAHDAEVRLLGAATRISEIWDIFTAAPERPDCDPKTLDDYEGLWKKVVSWIKRKNPTLITIADITTVTASDFAKDLGSRTGANTYNKAIGCYRLIWKTISTQTGWVQNPWATIARKQFEAVSKRELTIEEMRTVVATAQGEFKSFMLIGMYTGLRKKDVALLKWCDVDTSQQMLRVMPFKTMRRKKKTVHVAIPQAIAEILTPGARTGKYVMPKIAEMYLNQQRTLSRRIAQIFDDAGIQRMAEVTPATHVRQPVKVGYHSLRHSFVSICSENDVPLAVVQAIVGHGSPAMTRHYTHIGAEAARKAAAILPGLQENKAPKLPAQTWIVQELGKMTADNWQLVRDRIINGK